MNGWMGKILKVNLTDGTLTEIPTMDHAEKYLGGRGVASRLYWEQVTPEVKAFDPENRLTFMTGPSQGRWVSSHIVASSSHRNVASSIRFITALETSVDDAAKEKTNMEYGDIPFGSESETLQEAPEVNLGTNTITKIHFTNYTGNWS